MSERKPGPLVAAVSRSCCPVCGKASYSLSGTHPQCAVAHADADLRAARKATSAVAERPPTRKQWSKPCPKCARQVPARRFVCDCGHNFAQTATSQRNGLIDDRPGDSRQEQGQPQVLSFGATTMRAAPVPDRMISQQVNNKLASRGVCSPCHVAVLTRNGEVTLSGSVRYGHQKATAVQAATGITGVRRVIDQLIVKAIVKR